MLAHWSNAQVLMTARTKVVTFLLQYRISLQANFSPSTYIFCYVEKEAATQLTPITQEYFHTLLQVFICIYSCQVAKIFFLFCCHSFY